MTPQYRESVFKRLLWVATAFALVVSLGMALGSCNTDKGLSRRSAKHWHKSYRLHKITNAELCGQTYNPTDSVNEKTVYIPGEIITQHDTIVDVQTERINDTVYRTKYITKTVHKTDTVYIVKYKQEVNNASLTSCNEKVSKLNIDLAKAKKSLSIALWVCGALGLLILFWIIKKI